MKKWELKVNRNDEDKFISNNSIVVFGTTLLLAIILFVSLAIYVGNQAKEDSMYESGNTTENTLYLDSFKLNKVGGGINTIEAKVYNQTWLECDGSNDYIKITPESSDSFTFWYKSLNNWHFVANVWDTLYVDGLEASPPEYPVYKDGNDFYFCKTDSSTYWAGSIDEIRFYEGQLSILDINNLFEAGR